MDPHLWRPHDEEMIPAKNMVVRHKRAGGKYVIHAVGLTKVDGLWMESVSYAIIDLTDATLFTRLLDDFKNSFEEVK